MKIFAARWPLRPFVPLVVFLGAVFLMGGGARGDIQSLVILRPLAVLVCFGALMTLRREQLAGYKFLMAMAIAVFALVAIHLVPLPPSLWEALPGREPQAEIDRVAGLGAVWRPIAMDPDQGWNALFSLFVPLAVLLLGIQLRGSELFKLLWVCLGFGLASTLLAVFQLAGQADGPLYLYRITNYGIGVGLFSNRNHQALLLVMLYPLLAAYAANPRSRGRSTRFREWSAFAFGAALVPLIMVTGSRAGVIMAVPAIGISLWIWSRNRQAAATKQSEKPAGLKSSKGLIGLAVAVVIGLGALTVLMSRDEAIKRMNFGGHSEELRLQIWPPIVDLVAQYFPVGSGIGSFVKAYQIDEPERLLSPNYLNHAHNDILEVLMTAGLPGALLMLIALAAGLKAGFLAFTRSGREGMTRLYGQVGFVMLGILAVGSALDYPLRTPSMACVFVIACLWIAGPTASGRDGNDVAAHN